MAGRRHDAIEITVNGQLRLVEATPATPLLYVLRNELRLNAAKYGCGLARCGACVVLIDGERVPSCTCPVGEVVGKEVVTLEGLGSAAAPHPIQQAFLTEQAAQCGYCIPGMMIAAAALLRRNTEPSETEIVEALSGNLCRCGVHARIVRAVQRAAGSSAITQDPTAASRLGLPAPTGKSRQIATPAPGTVHVQTRDRSGETIGSWLEIDADGNVAVYAGKVELGTGITTALAQIVAEELDVAFARVTMILGDTAITPDQGTTAGSKTIQRAGPVLRQAAADARLILLTRAAAHFDVPADDLQTADGVVRVIRDPTRTVPYGALAVAPLTQVIAGDAPVKPPATHTIVGQSIPRVDLLAKLTGGEAFVQDIRLDGMLHGRVIRPHVRTLDGVGATIQEVDDRDVRDLPGLVAIVRNGNFVGVVAEREEQAIRAAERLRVIWSAPAHLPDNARFFETMRDLPAEVAEIVHTGDVERALAMAAMTHEATYVLPCQAHAAMGPSCAVADVRPDGATIYSSTQGVYALAGAIAPILGLAPEQVRVIHTEGAGCYGHNGADDVSADAAVLSQAVGHPVRVQWSRADEFAWEPKGPAMLTDLRGGLDAEGSVIAWDYEVWTPTHSTRPGGEPSRLLAGQLIDPPFPASGSRQAGGDRNAPTNYAFPHNRVTVHWIASPPLRQGSLRSLGGLHNTTANEIFLDELAVLAGADPVEFRLRHLTDPRAIAVIRRAAVVAGWRTRPSGPTAAGAAPSRPGELRTGRGIAFVRYETAFAYAAVIAEVAVDPANGVVRVTRIVVAHDCGQIINPDGVANQIEGNVVQGIGRAMTEEVTWDRTRVTSLDWSTYRILGFAEMPRIDIALINRPEEPPLGAGEPAICPVIAAVSNAIHDATGARLRTAPYTPARVLAALPAGSAAC